MLQPRSGMQTLRQTIAHLQDRGYDASFRPEQGRLLCLDSGLLIDPRRVKVDEILRVEGDSNPAEQTMVLALHDPKSETRGMWIVQHGPQVSGEASSLLRRLHLEDTPLP